MRPWTPSYRRSSCAPSTTHERPGSRSIVQYGHLSRMVVLGYPTAGPARARRIGWPRLRCVSAWRHARTTESTSPCHGKCELPCSGMNVAPGIAAATSRPSGYGTVVATVYDRRRLADKWNVGERRAVRRGSTMRLPFLPSPTRAATVRSVPVPRRLHHRGRCH